VLIALASSCLGGTAAAITRYLVGNADPITLAILRWGIGFACVLPVALLRRAKWPDRADWPYVALLGIAFFGLFFILYNIAVGFTTAARASLALATLPLQTMVVGALLGIEPLTARKSIGVGVAVLARRTDHDGRGAVHGVLQRAIAPVDPTIERARVSDRRYGRGRCGVSRRGFVHR
jgi:drug/metabolite transporter (DMT)-like permease